MEGTNIGRVLPPLNALHCDLTLTLLRPRYGGLHRGNNQLEMDLLVLHHRRESSSSDLIVLILSSLVFWLYWP